MRVVVIGGIADSLLRFRGPLIRALVAAGHEVTALAGDTEPEVSEELAQLGARFATYSLDRAGTGPLSDIATFRGLLARLRETRAEAVIAYTAKPVVWGALAARCAGVPHFHALITGRGEQFEAAGPAGLRRGLLLRLYRLALARARTVVFQNSEDRDFFVSAGLVDDARTALVDGSGVDLSFWTEEPLPDGSPAFLMITRLLRSKGVAEYAEAARRVRRDHPDVRFQLIGTPEAGARGVAIADIERWQAEGSIDYVGALPNVRASLQGCHVYVLPSYYGEGVPRSILEAMATGRSVLSTDNVGCRDAVEHDVTGRLVMPRDADALEEGMRWFLAHRDLWSVMGRAGRRRVERLYDVEIVNANLLRITGLGAA